MNFTDQVYDNAPVLQMFFGKPGQAQIVNAQKVRPAVAYKSFIDWLKAKFPQVYSGLEYSRPDLAHPDAIFVNAGFMGMGEGEADVTLGTDAPVDPSIFDKLLQSIDKIVPAYLQYSSQQDLIKLNIERAKQGMTPIDSSTIAPSVKIGVTSDVQRIGTVAVFGMLGLGALMILLNAKKRR